MNGHAPQFDAWKGKTETLKDIAAAAPLRALGALLDRSLDDREGAALPLPAHWLYFLPTAPQSSIDVDGHPKRGGFLPLVELPRRMWAGSRIRCHGDVRIGAPITRLSRIEDVTTKQGRAGALVFVRVSHELRCNGEVAITEEQDIVYRDAPQPGAQNMPTPAPTGERWQREIKPDPVLLFRYSAITFNGHRIHYDRPYATEVEHYPGLVVHGPLIATLLLDLVYRNVPNARVAEFSFKAVAPLFDLQPFFVCAQPDAQTPQLIRLWAKDADGNLATEAQVRLA